jgi:pyruvate dehydrogenase E2 component (dihydrolipoamide acetyltransferase)
MVPVVRNADQQDLFTLAVTIGSLQARAKMGQLTNSELTGSTVTISNLGMFGVDNFIAVINPPEAAILALGTIRPRATVVDGTVVPRHVMTATLSVDHRAVDGVQAARFLNEIKRLLEHPSEGIVQGLSGKTDGQPS